MSIKRRGTRVSTILPGGSSLRSAHQPKVASKRTSSHTSVTPISWRKPDAAQARARRLRMPSRSSSCTSLHCRTALVNLRLSSTAQRWRCTRNARTALSESSTGQSVINNHGLKVQRGISTSTSQMPFRISCPAGNTAYVHVQRVAIRWFHIAIPAATMPRTTGDFIWCGSDTGPRQRSATGVLRGAFDNWQQVSDANLNHVVAYAASLLLRIYVEKIGSPGALYLAGPAVFVT